MDSFLGGQPGHSSSFYEFDYAKADLSSSRISTGRTTSPMMSTSPKPTILPNIFDQIAEWFNGIIVRRKMISSAVSACSSVILFFILTATLQSSIWSPLGSIYDGICLPFSARAWTAAIFVWITSFGSLTLINAYFAKPDINRRISVLGINGWAATMIYLFSQFIMIYMSHSIARSSIESCRWLFILVTLIISSIHVLFRLDYRLVFGNYGSKLSLAIWECFSLEGESPLMLSIKETALLYRFFIPSAIVLGSLVYGITSTFLSLLSPSLHLCLLFTSLSTIFIGRFNIRITREITMQPLIFPLPPPHVVRSPTPSETRTLLNVLEVDNITLKLFALSDLCRLSNMAGDRRQEVFSLSQPGGHPRNWSSIRAVCLRIIDEVREKMESATRSISDPSNLSIDDYDGIDRQMLMMPERIRQQVYSTAVRSRHIRSLKATVSLQPRVPPRPSLMERIKRLFDLPTGIISRHEASIVQLAAQSLNLLVVASFNEDRYGIVQRDLTQVLRTLIASSNSIDQYFRVRNARASDSEEDAPLVHVDDALHTAVYQIKTRFGDSLRSLDLTNEELNTIDQMC